MSEESKSSTGPDLSAGVASATIGEGTCVVGHHDGDAVLVARVDGRCHAVGATCPHYGGPLAEGLITGHAVRCPWHHAEFDLRSGSCSRPPAFDDLPTFEVTEADGVVRVTAKAARATARYGTCRKGESSPPRPWGAIAPTFAPSWSSSAAARCSGERQDSPGRSGIPRRGTVPS